MVCGGGREKQKINRLKTNKMKKRIIATHSLIRDIVEELKPYVRPYAISIEDYYEIDDTEEWVRDNIRLWVHVRAQADKQDDHLASMTLEHRPLGKRDLARYCAGYVLGKTPKEYFHPGMYEKFHEKDWELEMVLEPEEEDKDPFTL